MNRNKIVSIIIIVIVVLIIVLFFINNYFAAKKTNIVSPSQQTTSVASLPVSGTKNQIINDPKNLEEINSAFTNAISQPVVTSEVATLGFQPIEYTDKNNQTIPLGDFIKATGIKINTNIQNLLREDDYFTFLCPESQNNFKYGVVFHIKLLGSNKNLPLEEAQWMKEWEKTMLKDSYKIIFPDIDFNDDELNQELKFKDGKYRFADISLPNGMKGSINYFIVGDYVIIASSKDCLGKVNDYVEPIEP